MKFLSLLILMSFPGCVSVPIPPFGNNVGQFGRLKISAKISYIPNGAEESAPTDSMWYAWKQFKLTNQKLLTDK